MTAYFIDGKEARDDDYIRAIDSLPENDFSYVDIGFQDTGLRISTFPGGFQVLHFQPDGSSWNVRGVLGRDRVKDLVASFLKGGDKWREGLEWDQVELTSKEGTRRTTRIVVIGAILVGVGFYLVKLLTR